MIKNIIPILVYLALALILMMPLLPPGYYLALDMQYGPSSFADFQFPNLYGMAPSPYGAYLPYRLVMAALSDVFGVEAVEKLLLFAILFLPGMCMHLSLPKETGNSRYFGGLLYALNPFVYIRFLAGHWSLLLSYALWPLGLKYFMEFLEKPSERDALAKAALVTSLAAVSSHGVLMLLLSYLVLFSIHLLRSKNRVALVQNTVALGALVLFLNLYWIAPTLALFGERFEPASSESNLAEFNARGQGMPIPLTLLSMHGFWRGGFQYTMKAFDLWYVPLIIILSLAISGLAVLYKKKDAMWIFFLLLIPIALLLALGDDGPLPALFGLFESHIPVYYFFRDSQKFVGLICLSYAFLGTIAANEISMRLRGLGSLILIGILCAAPIIYNYGFFGFMGQIGPTQYPDDWKQAEAIISADPTPSNILFLPLHFYIYYPWVNGTQKDIGAPARVFFSKPVIVSRNMETRNVYRDVKDPPADYMRFLYDNRQYVNDTAELLLPLNIRYVMLMKGFRESPRILYLFYRQGGVPNIELVYESDSFYLFRNNLAKGPFIASSEDGSGGFESLLNLSAALDYSTNVTYEKITPASYRVLSSGSQYAVWAEHQNGFISYGGSPASSWHNLASSFAFNKPAVVENMLFYAVLALFIMACLLAMLLFLPADASSLPVLAFAGLALMALAATGHLGPNGLGWLILASATSLFIKLLHGSGNLRKPFKPKSSSKMHVK